MMQMHDAELSQAYREARHPEPSPALDARILAAAQAAVAPQRRRPAWFGWAVPLSTTAVLVLGISLLFRMQLEAPETLREDMPPLPTIESDANPKATPAPVARSVAPAAPVMAERQADRAAAAPIPRSAPTVAAPVPESASNEAAVASVASAPAALEERAAVPAPAPSDTASAGASLVKEDAIRAERNSAAKSLSPSAAPASAARLKQGMSRMRAAEPMLESPEQWVESIRKLLREGHIEAARKSVEGLQKRYPDFPLPPDLEPSRCCPLPATSAE